MTRSIAHHPEAPDGLPWLVVRDTGLTVDGGPQLLVESVHAQFSEAQDAMREGERWGRA